MQTDNNSPMQATLFRMVLPDHVCPFGLKALELLRRNGFEVEDYQLTTREQTETLMAELGVATTPQVFIGEEHIGGADELERWLAQA